LHIPALCLSIFGTIQPGKLQAYISGALKGGAGDDGLLQRLQLIVWPEISPDWVNVDRAPDQDARQQAYQIFQDIDELSARDIGAVSQPGDIPALRFSTAAQEHFDTFRNELELRLRSDEFATAPAFESYLSKFRSLMPSLALIFHIVEVVNTIRVPSP
jgi:putative DNA primase/helicase